jgi:hypothetical protein
LRDTPKLRTRNNILDEPKMNILHGDSAAGSFKAAFQLNDDGLLVFRDILSCGPLIEFTDITRWQKQRLSFWSEVCSNNCVDMQAITTLPGDFYSNFSIFKAAPECKLWIGTGLSDQLLLAFIVHLFDALKLDFGKLSIIQFEKFKNNKGSYHPVQGLGLLEPEKIKEHPAPSQINEKQIQYVKSAWEAFAAPTPELYMEFMAGDSDVMPLLHIAMSYIYYRYPNVINGLSSSDETLLKNTSDHRPKATKVIGYTLTDEFRGLDLVGDWYLFSRLKNLASSKIKNPLVKMNPPDRAMRETEVQITEFGKLALENKINVLKENGSDDWIGGVHLDFKNNNVWVRKNEKLCRLEDI